MTAKYHGRFSIKVENTETGEVRELPEQDNLVLDQFFSLPLSRGDISYYVCFLVTGSIAPTVSDTRLENPIAGSLISGQSSFIINNTRNGNTFLSEKTIVMGKYGSTDIVGNISELGLSFNAAISNLFTRALIKDELGNPTTISVGATDILTVTYTYGITIDLTSPLITTKTVTINGVSTLVKLYWVDYDNNAGNYSFWSSSGGFKKMATRNPGSFIKYLNPFTGVITDFSNIGTQITPLKSWDKETPNFNATHTDGTVSGPKASNAVFTEGRCTGTWDGIIFYLDRVPQYTCALTFDPPLVKGPDDVFTIDELIVGAIRGS